MTKPELTIIQIRVKCLILMMQAHDDRMLWAMGKLTESQVLDRAEVRLADWECYAQTLRRLEGEGKNAA